MEAKETRNKLLNVYVSIYKFKKNRPLSIILIFNALQTKNNLEIGFGN
jgi:hypothetical protein